MKYLYQLLTILLVLTLSAQVSKAAEPQKPNILFCIADDASMKSFGAYGCDYIKTPSVDRLAREGVTFINAYNCNPKCAPARACIVTGMYSWQLKEACNHFPAFPEEFKHYPQLLMNNGYHVGYTGKGWGPGVYSSKHNPAGPEYNKIKLKAPYKGISNIDYAANFECFLNKKDKNTPFCFWLGTKEPHRSYEKDSYKQAGFNLKDAEVPPFYPDNSTVRGDVLDYAVEVEWFDTHVGKAIKILEEKGLLDNTLVLISSDHGMPFPRIKGQLYEEGFHVPLVAYWKGVIKAGRVIDDFISFPDIAPTFMEMAGLKSHAQMTGNSFLSLLQSHRSGQIEKKRDHVLLGKERHDIGRSNAAGIDLTYPVRAIRTAEFLYVHNIQPERWPVGNPEFGFRNCDNSPTKSYITGISSNSGEYKFYELCFEKRPEEELYNIVSDPNCMNNLADSPEYAKVKNDLRTAMEKELKAQGDTRTLGKGKLFDEYKYQGRQLNYKTGELYPKKKK